VKFLLLSLYLFYSSLYASIKSDFIHSKAYRYEAITEEEFDTAIKLFGLIFAQKNPKLQSQYLKSLKLSTQRYKNILLIKDTAQRGWGFYLIRQNINKGSLLSIPHRFNDKGTAQIARRLFMNFPYKAVAFNTISRKVMDSAHTTKSLFSAFHLAFVASFPKQNIYQLHGFANSKRHSSQGKIAKAIVSSTHSPTPKTQALVSCMQTFQNNVLLYGKDIFELGARTNAQGRLLRQKGYEYFTHIELSQEFRTKLQKDALLRKHLHKCLP